MKIPRLPLAFFFAVALLSCSNEKQDAAVFEWKVDPPKSDFAKYVDPMIGTDGHGHTFPGATAPFGMVQVSPDTRYDGSWDGCSGYHYSDDTIYGFSHTHLSGTGCSDYGDILLMPGTGAINFDSGKNGYDGYASPFSHKNEKAEAGYYSVQLDRPNVLAELTASPRVGVHRYTFASNEGWVMIDLKHRDEVLDAHLEIVDDHTIRGYRFSKAWAADQRLWFYAEFSQPFKRHSIGGDEKKDSLTGKNIKCALSFDLDKSQPLVVKVALSPVSCENAKLNMETEVPDFDFDAVRKKVTDQWNDELGKIEVKDEHPAQIRMKDDTRPLPEDGTKTKKKVFYTALYHCFISPNLYSDVNGEYRGRDNHVHRDTVHPQYTVFSLWDTYRALHPLFTIVQQKRTNDFINTFVKQYKEGGRLPVWELSANETNCMIGYHSVPVIVDAWMKGLTDWDTAAAFEAMKHSATEDFRGLKEYRKFGFIPAEGEGESVSKTLEYAYDDWCISLAAHRMKNNNDEKLYSDRAQSWKNLFDLSAGFFRPRLNNSFVQPFNPDEVNFHYTEANAWQYSLAVQQDVNGLIEASGGKAKFLEHLDSLFSVSSKTSGRDQADITGMIGQYAQGNEPSHHMAYLYTFAGEQWKTAACTDRLCQLYTTQPDGLPGNEDCGQMSAWYVMTAMGFYPVTPGANYYVLGLPQFDNVTIHLENGKTFSLHHKQSLSPWNDPNRSDCAPGCIYKATLNQSDWTNTFLYHNDIVNGGTFEYELDCDLSRGGGAIMNHLQHLPPATFTGENIPLPPIVNVQDQNSRTFSTQMKIDLAAQEPSDEIFIRVNDQPFIMYRGNLKIQETSTIAAFSKRKNVNSDTVQFTFTKNAGKKSITLNTTYAPQYAAGGNDALIDGIEGTENFRTGTWQGYEGKNIDVVIRFETPQAIDELTIGFLQDQNSWIFLPQSVEVWYSSDGKNYSSAGIIQTNTPWQTDPPFVKRISVPVHQNGIRFIKIVAKNRGTCPPGHPGAGKPAWIFTDEIHFTSKS